MLPKAFRNLRPVTINRKSVEGIIENIDGLERLVPYMNDPLVMAEVLQFREARQRNPNALARNIILFSLLSPQTRLDANVAAFRNVSALWDSDATFSQVEQAIYGVSFHVNKAKYILEARNFLNDPNLSTRMTAKNLLSLKGMGNKTTAFALALFDDMAPVFTLDLHMLRAIAWATGGDHAVNVMLQKAAYAPLESAVVDFLQRQAIASPFVAQWSLWNAWGFNRHVSHLSILEGV